MRAEKMHPTAEPNAKSEYRNTPFLTRFDCSWVNMTSSSSADRNDETRAGERAVNLKLREMLSGAGPYELRALPARCLWQLDRLSSEGVSDQDQPKKDR
jgi:hypothetical protein